MNKCTIIFFQIYDKYFLSVCQTFFNMRWIFFSYAIHIFLLYNELCLILNSNTLYFLFFPVARSFSFISFFPFFFCCPLFSYFEIHKDFQNSRELFQNIWTYMKNMWTVFWNYMDIFQMNDDRFYYTNFFNTWWTFLNKYIFGSSTSARKPYVHSLTPL